MMIFFQIMWNNKAWKFNGISTIRLKMSNKHDKREFLIYNVRHVFEFKWKFLNMFDNLSYCIRIECGVLKISHGALIIAKGFKMCRLYILNGSTTIGHTSVVSQDLLDKSKFWHLRLGHVSEKGVVEPTKKMFDKEHALVAG